MPEPTEEEILGFRKFKEKHLWPEQVLSRQKDLREFKEEFGVDTRSNFHCLWCYTGSLYDCVDPTAPGVADIEIPEGFELYVCRGGCQLRFLIKCCDPGVLAKDIAKKKEERQQRREAKKADERTPEEMQQMLETYRAAQAAQESEE